MSGVAGKHPFESWISGKKVGRKDAMLAKCYDCMGFYEDGLGDCGDPKCPLYPWMPYHAT